MSELTLDGAAEPSREAKNLSANANRGILVFHEQDWQPYPVDPDSCYICDYKYIHTYRLMSVLEIGQIDQSIACQQEGL